MQLKSIGILGGTFDPIHLGHFQLAYNIHHLLGLQKIFFIPCAQSPFRKKPVACAQDRLNMIKLAIDNPGMFVADEREILRGGTSFTVDTLESIRREYSNVSLVLVMGVDAFNNFNTWMLPQKILELANLVVVSRAGFVQTNGFSDAIRSLLKNHQADSPECLQKKSSGLIYLADIKLPQVSSTQIRKLFGEYKLEEAKALVAPCVWQYVCEKKLYI